MLSRIGIMMKARTITIITLFIFILGFIVGHYVFPKQEMNYLSDRNLYLVKSLQTEDDQDIPDTIDMFRIEVYSELSWELHPSYFYNIKDWRSFIPKSQNSHIDFLLVKAGHGSMVGLITKDNPKELLVIYNCDTHESCDNWSMSDSVVIKKMLNEFCSEMNDYSYYMKSEDGVIIIDEHTKLPILKPKETELPLPVKEAN